MNQKAKLKKTEIGEIPEDWEVKTAETFCERVTDGTHASPKKKIKGKFLITSRHLKQNKLDFNNSYFISEEDFEEVNKRSKVDQFDILFSMIGTVGETYQERSDNIRYAIKNVGLFKFGGHQKESDWFLYWLKSPIAKDYIQTRQAGSTQQYLTLEALRKFPLAIPKNPKEQHQIAKILSDLDSKIELLQKQNQTLEKIGQSLFKYWFVDFEFPNEKGKPYKSSGGEMVDIELREIPKRWKYVQLKETLRTIESGRRPKGGIDSTLKTGVPSIGAENINGLGYYDYSSTKYISQEYFEDMNQGIIQDRDVLIYKDGAKLGRKTMFGGGFPFKICCINEHVFIIRVNQKLNQEYLYFWLDQSKVTEDIKSLNTNSAQPGINKEAFGNLKIIVPERLIIDAFSNVIKQLIDKIFLNCLNSKNLSQIRDSLLPKLMSGKVRVPVEVRA